MKVFVTAVGIVSAVGGNAKENFESLRSRSTGIRFSDTYGLMIGEVQRTNDEIIRSLELPPYDYSRTTLLGLIAAKEAWGANTHHRQLRSGLISATSVGGMDRVEYYYRKLKKEGDGNAFSMMTHDNGRCTDTMARVMNFEGFIDTISTACSSGANAVMHAARMIRSNRLDRVLAGGAEPLANFDVKGFSSLNIYDPDLCRPFDENRKGLNLGEGAAYILLESERSLAVTKNEPICMVTGWGNATDAYHQTASSPEGKGAFLTMSKALETAGILPEDIDYINAHGTGTGNNDLSESAAIRKVFGDKVPPFSSTKGFTGHTLGAAGAIEAAYCIQAIQHQCLFPNLNFETPMPETGLVPQNRFTDGVRVRNVITNSFGFGGNCTSLLFSQTR